MKIRASFVANSSSSSFLILGKAMDVFDEEKHGDEQDCYEIVEQYRRESGVDVIQRTEDSTECYVGKIIYDTSGGSMSIADFEKEIADAKAFLIANGMSDYKVCYGEAYS